MRKKIIGRVHNDMTHEHVEKFKGDEIRIPAGEYVDMPYSDAVQFKGQFFPTIGKKRLRLEQIVPPDLREELEKSIEQTCPKCAENFDTEVGLNTHIEEKHFDDLSEEVQKQIKKKRAKGGRRPAAA